MTTMARLRAELRRLVAGERTEEATEEAARLVAEYNAAQARKRRPEPAAEEVAAAKRREEDRRWAKTLAMIGRGGGAMSTPIWSPGGRDHEPAWTRQNEAKTYARRQSPWR